MLIMVTQFHIFGEWHAFFCSNFQIIFPVPLKQLLIAYKTDPKKDCELACQAMFGLSASTKICENIHTLHGSIF